MKLKALTKITINCNKCSKPQSFCITGRPLSGLCTDCRKKEFKTKNPIDKKPDLYCTECSVEVGKNSRTIKCRSCYVLSRKDTIAEYNKKYCKERYNKDPIFMISKRLRSRLSHAIREAFIDKGRVSAIKHLGCSVDFLKIHLESQFTPGMTWSNYGEWHIDHIKPLSSAVGEIELYSLVKYNNLQPLWAKDNMSKGAKSG